MVEKMSRWGVGPVFASVSIIYGMVVLGVSRYFWPFFRIPAIPEPVLRVLGIAFIGVGIPFFIISVKTVMAAYNSDKLVTHGIFKCCRHPLYGSWVVFIVPGIVLLANSWLGLTAPLFMYVLLAKLVTREEIYLERVFGSEYTTYKKRIPAILPLGPRKK